MNQSKTVLILIVILLASNIFFGIQYFFAVQELRRTETILETQATNGKVLVFTNLFIKEVLKAKTEVNFETRLKLENAVRNLEDEEILAQWSKFVESKTQENAQEEVKNLLEMLVNKIKVS